jgi:hypothetical protein
LRLIFEVFIGMMHMIYRWEATEISQPFCSETVPKFVTV